jgi:hypothetical protein
VEKDHSVLFIMLHCGRDFIIWQPSFHCRGRFWLEKGELSLWLCFLVLVAKFPVKGVEFIIVGQVTSLLDRVECCRGRFPLLEAEFLCWGLCSFAGGRNPCCGGQTLLLGTDYTPGCCHLMLGTILLLLGRSNIVAVIYRTVHKFLGCCTNLAGPISFVYRPVILS